MDDYETDPRFLKFSHYTDVGTYLANTPEDSWTELKNRYIAEGIIERFVFDDSSEEYLNGIIFITENRKLEFLLRHG